MYFISLFTQTRKNVEYIALCYYKTEAQNMGIDYY